MAFGAPCGRLSLSRSLPTCFQHWGSGLWWRLPGGYGGQQWQPGSVVAAGGQAADGRLSAWETWEKCMPRSRE